VSGMWPDRGPGQRRNVGAVGAVGDNVAHIHSDTGPLPQLPSERGLVGLAGLDLPLGNSHKPARTSVERRWVMRYRPCCSMIATATRM